MKFNVQLKHLGTGQWQVRYIGGQVETLNVVDEKKDRALERMRESIRYHLEYCP
jgi:hypothetical protein